MDGEASRLIGSVKGILREALAYNLEVCKLVLLTNCALPHVLGGLLVCLLEDLASSVSIGRREKGSRKGAYTGLI